jgi:hypothetical protein
MKLYPRVIFALILLFVRLPADAQGTAGHQFTPDTIKWIDAPAPLPSNTKVAVLFGSPTAGGSFTVRLLLPATTVVTGGMRVIDHRMTVLSGVVQLQIGGKIVNTFPAGSFLSVSPYDGDVVALQESVLEVSSSGRWLKGPKTIAFPPVEAMPLRTPDADIELIEILPGAGTTVSAAMTIHAVVRYDIRDFKPDTFRIAPMFESNIEGSTFSNDERKTPPEALKTASGTITFDYPLARTISDPHLHRPIHLWFFLLREVGGGRSMPLVRTPTTVYNVE